MSNAHSLETNVLVCDKLIRICAMSDHSIKQAFSVMGPLGFPCDNMTPEELQGAIKMLDWILDVVIFDERPT